MAVFDPWPDLRHVRYVLLSPHVPGTRSDAELSLGARMLRNGVLGASVAGSFAVHAGRPLTGLVLGAVLGTASAFVSALRPRSSTRGFALVPWGLLVEDSDEITAVRWSGVHDLDVRYRATRDGTVRTRIAVESVVGSLVGWASDALDIGALAGNLEDVAAASARPLATDLAGQEGTRDGEPFVERVLDAARKLVDLEGDRTLGLEPSSYRDARGALGEQKEPPRVVRTLRALGLGATGEADPWGLIAAVAGELRLSAFARELAKLANVPHPGVAAIARAALLRLRARGVPREEEPSEDLEALSWFVPPDELSRLRAWGAA